MSNPVMKIDAVMAVATDGGRMVLTVRDAYGPRDLVMGEDVAADMATLLRRGLSDLESQDGL